MKTQVVQTEPTRENWQQFCSEPPLDEHEASLLSEMRCAARESEALQVYLAAKCAAEYDEVLRSNTGIPFYTRDWSDMVDWADRNRRAQRAEIEAFQEWKQRMGAEHRVYRI